MMMKFWLWRLLVDKYVFIFQISLASSALAMDSGAMMPSAAGQLIAETSKDVQVLNEGVKRIAGLVCFNLDLIWCRTVSVKFHGHVGYPYILLYIS